MSPPVRRHRHRAGPPRIDPRSEERFRVLVEQALAERQALEDQLRHRAFHDALTGLANRALFANRVEHALVRTARLDGTTMAVLFLDLDDFKTINDTLGHAEGDVLLVLVAERLRESLRSGDTAARLGGDEFAVLLEDLRDEAEAVQVAERILAALREPFLLQGREVAVGASIGIAPGRHAHGGDTILRDADVAMYIAKSRGKNRFVVFEPEMHLRIIERMALRADLERALDEGSEFHLRYHPVVDLSSGNIAGMEALIRWDHPHRGLISPADFIPLAEETGLIVPLGHWILEQAAGQAARLAARHRTEFFLTVNLSARQLSDPALIDRVSRMIEASGLRPERLVLEITESVLLHDAEPTLNRLAELKALGLRLAVDDFGTGYSSLAYLRRFPVDIIKVDKSFVDHVEEREGAALTRAIVDLAGVLGLATIAEGIERAGQAQQLLGLGCELGQGFHYARPMTASEMDAFLSASAAAGPR